MKRKRRIVYLPILLLTAVAFLSSCGFHLRGSVSLPKWLNNVYIVTLGKDRNLERMLKMHMKENGIYVNENAAEAKYWLEIVAAYFEKNIVSVSSSTSPRQYQLNYYVKFKLTLAKGREILPTGQVTVSRPLTINNNRILGSNYEEDIIKNEIKRDAAFLILNQIGRVAKD